MRNKKKSALPTQYKMKTFPLSIDFFIPGFLEKHLPGIEKSLAIEKRDCSQWYNEFIDKCINACGKKYFPIYRMSDGEFLFVLGEQPLDIRLSIFEKIRTWLSNFRARFFLKGGLGAFTEGHYHSGEYSLKEWGKAKLEQPEQIKEISNNGILALHLSYVETQPFAERYWPALDKWIIKHNITINNDNYYPFYFVYAMLTGSRRRELLKGRRVLVVNGAKGAKKQDIIKGLKREGVVKVEWCSISLKRSMFDIIDVKPYIGQVDLAFVGAGIAKPYILLQMKSLNVPCIDAGYVFEVWANPDNKWNRPVCANDKDYEELRKNNL